MEEKMVMNQNPDAGEKTFSQDDVNRIIGERLAKERAKADAAAAEREKELTARELRLTAREMLNERKLPGYLVDALDFSNKETMEKGLQLIEKAVRENNGAGKPLPGARPANPARFSIDKPEQELREAFGLK